MVQATDSPFVTYRAYAQAEELGEARHEWHDGIVVAMAGGTPRHGALASRIIVALSRAVDGRPCQVLTSDVKVRIKASRLGTYPDVSVVCGPIEVDDEDPNSILNPVLLVEVLSDSTEPYDRGAKFAYYRAIPTLTAVLLVRHRSPALELFTKDDAGTWRVAEALAGQTLSLEALDCVLDVDAIYRDLPA